MRKFGVLLAGSMAQQLLVMECGFLGLSSWALETAPVCTERDLFQQMEREQVWGKCGVMQSVCFWPQSADLTRQPIPQPCKHKL